MYSKDSKSLKISIPIINCTQIRQKYACSRQEIIYNLLILCYFLAPQRLPNIQVIEVNKAILQQ
jgi:hypothetical protein